MRQILQEQATSAARLSGFMQRERAIDGARFVQSVVGAYWAEPNASYEQVVGVAAGLGVSISPQAFAERCSDAAVRCLQQVLAATMQQVMTAAPAALPLLDRFVAVEVQDSTTISLPDTLATIFAGCGGRDGQGAAAVKAQLRWELRSGRLDGPLLQDGRAADRAVAFRQRAVPGTLQLRDLGYWQLDDLASDAQDGRFWLQRFKPGTALFTADGQRHELSTLLATQRADAVEQAVQIGVRHQLACRLIARRVDAALAAARLRRAEQTARRKGRTLTAATRQLCAWEVLVTNVPASVLSAAECWILLSVRWQIELLFKLWKQHGKLDESRGRQPGRVLVELYAKFIGVLLQHWLLLAACWAQPDRSLVKAARVTRPWAERLLQALKEPARLEQLLTDLVAAMQRAGRQTRRKTQPGTWQRLGGQPTVLA